MKIAIVGGRVIDPATKMDECANVYIDKGKIINVSSSLLPDFDADVTLSAEKYIVCPGIVDLNANILSQTITFEDNLKNAVAAGITHLATHAFTPNRCLAPSEIQYLSGLSAKHKLAKPYFIGALTQNLEGNRLNELMLLKEAGCIGFTNSYYPIPNTLVKRRCYDYAAMLGLKVYLVLEDSYLSEDGCMHEGEVSVNLGLSGIPSLSEAIALSRELLLIEDTGINAHFYRISARKTVELLEKVDSKMMTVSSDVAIHQLFLTDKNVELQNGFCRVRPPLRTQSDKEALRNAVKKGVIESISSDHITLPKHAKEAPFQDSEPGIASWPLLLPLTLKLAQEENIPFSQALNWITSSPADILGIEVGIRQNASANVLIFDQEQRWSLSKHDLMKFGENNPFAGWQLQGRVKYTIVDGQIVYEDD